MLSKTTAGRKIYKENEVGVVDTGGSEDDRFLPIIMFLCSVEWFHSDNAKHEVHCAQICLQNVIDDIKTCFPRTTGLGWNLPKTHQFLLMRVYMMFYGNGFNFYGGWGERAHITHVKDNAGNTQMQPSTFVAQLGTRVEEKRIISEAEECLASQFADQVADMPRSNSLRKKQIELENYKDAGIDGANTPPFFVNEKYTGGYTVTIDLRGDVEAIRQFELSNDTQCVIERQIRWDHRNKEKQKMKRGICFELSLYIAKLGLMTPNCTRATVQGYTMAFVQFPGLPNRTIIRCTDDYNSEPWYDFVAVQVGDNVLAAKVIGIIVLDKVAKLIVRCMHTTGQDKYNVMDELFESFFLDFELGGFDSVMAVEVKELRSPLLVIPNYGENTKTHFVAALPKRSHGRRFGNTIRNHQKFLMTDPGPQIWLDSTSSNST